MSDARPGTGGVGSAPKRPTIAASRRRSARTVRSRVAASGPSSTRCGPRGRAPSARRPGRRPGRGRPPPARPPRRGRSGRPGAREPRAARRGTSGSSAAAGSSSHVTSPVVHGVPAPASTPSSRKRRTPVAMRWTAVPMTPSAIAIASTLASQPIPCRSRTASAPTSCPFRMSSTPKRSSSSSSARPRRARGTALEQLEREPRAGQQDRPEREEWQRRTYVTVFSAGPRAEILRSPARRRVRHPGAPDAGLWTPVP